MKGLLAKAQESGIFKIIKNSGYFFASAVLSTFVSVFTFPIFCSYLSKSDFGVLAFFISVLNISANFSILSLTNYYIVKSQTIEETERKILLFNLIFFNFIWNIILAFIGVGILYTYLHFIDTEISLLPLAPVTFSILIFEGIITFWLIHLRISSRGEEYFITNSAQLVGNSLIGVLLVAYFSMGVLGKLLGILIANALVVIFILHRIKKDVIIKREFSIFWSGIKEMLPLTLSSFFSSTTASFDIVVLERFNRLQTLGEYSIGKQIATFVRIAGSSLFQAFEPGFYKRFQKESVFTSRFLLVFILMLSAILGSYFIFSSQIIEILTNGKFINSLTYSNVFVFQSFLIPVIQALNVKLYLEKRIVLLSLINFITGTLTILLVLFLSQTQPFTGTAYAYLFAALVQLILSIYYARKK
jgi:O-antigen/teichoic acid export membrane protein